MSDTLYELVFERLAQVGIFLKEMMSDVKNIDNRKNNNTGDAANASVSEPQESNIKSHLHPFDKNDLVYFADIMTAIKIFCIIDVTLKTQMTQCSHPIYLKKLDQLLSKILANNFKAMKDLIDLKMFCLEYGFLDRSNYGGPDSKTEELIRLLENAESKLEELETPFLEPINNPYDPNFIISKYMQQPEIPEVANEREQITTLNFLAILDLRKMSSELLLQHLNDTSDYMSENFPLQIKEVSLRIINLLSTIVLDPEKSSTLLVFIAQYRLMAKKKFHETGLFSVPNGCSFDLLSSHLIHDGTRGWLLNKIEEWLFSSEKPFFWLSGLEGMGKSCVISAFCKLNHCYVMNVFVFDSRQSHGMAELIKSIANSLMRNIPEYVCMMDDIIQESRAAEYKEDRDGSFKQWKKLYDFLLRKPLKALYSKLVDSCPKRRLVIIDGLNECNPEEWPDLVQFLQAFKQDLANWMCIFITCRSEFQFISPDLITQIEKKTESKQSLAAGEYKSFTELTEVINLESKNFINNHIKDVEKFFGDCFGDIMSKKKFGQTDATKNSPRYNPDHMALTEIVDKFLKQISGKFSYAQHLLTIFEEAMDEFSGQFQCSLIKTFERFRALVGDEKLEEEIKRFAKPFNAYRQKDGTAGVIYAFLFTYLYFHIIFRIKNFIVVKEEMVLTWFGYKKVIKGLRIKRGFQHELQCHVTWNKYYTIQ